MEEDTTLFNEQAQFCDKITLERFSAIQPYGVLLVINRENLQIIQCSRNVESISSIPPESLLNSSLSQFIRKKESLNFILNSHQKWQILTWEIEKKKIALFGYVSQHPQYIILEIERYTKTHSHEKLFELQQQIVMENKTSDSTEFFSEKANSICKLIRSLTKADRVLIYQFDYDNTGIVIAETHKKGMDPYMGLRFPATDIPLPVREMYIKNPIRYIPSANSQPVEMVPLLNPLTEKITDISFCHLRAVAPVHVEYMANMKISASLSVGIVHDQSLWGIIACHHLKPTSTPVCIRFLLLLMTNTFSSQLIAMENTRTLHFRNRSQMLQNSFAKMLTETLTLKEIVQKHSVQILELVNASGMTILAGDQLYNYGETPSLDEIKALAIWLQTTHPKELFFTDSLIKDLPGECEV